MNNKWLILINPLIAVMMLSQAVTALNYYFAFLDRKTFLALHLYGGYVLSGLVLIHLIINWFWVKNTFIKKKKAPPKGASQAKAPSVKAPAVKPAAVQNNEKAHEKEVKENPS